MDFFTVIFIVVFLIGLLIAYFIGHRIGSYRKHKEWEADLPGYRKDAIAKSRAVLGGQFSENLAPYLPNFPYLPTECRFLGKPTDFIVFKGMDEKKIDEVIFVEVKSGDSKISPQEKNLKDTIDKKRVRYEEYRISKDLTKKDGMEFEDDGQIRENK